MSNHQQAAKEFEDVLGLGSCLIGVKYDDKPDPRGDTGGNLPLVRQSMLSEEKRQSLTFQKKTATA